MKCRYCSTTEVAAQNYARHLRLVHKEECKEHPDDLREAGERVAIFFRSKHNAGGTVVEQHGDKEADDDYGGETDKGEESGDGEVDEVNRDRGYDHTVVGDQLDDSEIELDKEDELMIRINENLRELGHIQLVKRVSWSRGV